MSTTTHTSHIPIPGSRDLSGIANGQVHLTIQQAGREDKRYAFPPCYTEETTYADLLRLALHAQQEKTLAEWNPKECPYEVMSFNKEKNELTVKLAE